MASDPIPPAEAAPQPGGLAPLDRATRRALWFEVAAVLALAALPGVVGAITSIVEPASYRPSFATQALNSLAQSIGVAVPVLYIMWRSGGGLARFGLTRARPVHVLAGLGLWALMYCLDYAWWTVLSPFPVVAESADDWSAATQGYFARPDGPVDLILLGAFSAANGFAEELVICGFLMARLPMLLGGTARAVGVAALVFASYHVYQGPVAAVQLFFIACIWLAIYAGARVLWPFAIAHALQDFIAFL